MFRSFRFFLSLVAALSLSACALAYRSPRIAELKYNPGRYQDKTVRIQGVVTSSWGVPLVPFRFYRVDDGTGEVVVLSQGHRTPARGARVSVKGRVNQFGVFGGRSVGLHLEERDLDFKRY